MGLVDIAKLAYAPSAVRDSWSTTVTIPVGKGPASLFVVMLCGYDEFAVTACSINGISAQQVAHIGTGYAYAIAWTLGGLQPGNIPVVVSGLGNFRDTYGWVVGIYNTSGHNPDNLITRTNPPDSYTATPNLFRGQLWVEVARGENYLPVTHSGQVTLDSSEITLLSYKKDNGSGEVSFNTTFAAGLASELYLGMEFLPAGAIFGVPPIPIG
jgi:hypothetical protein